MAQDWSLTPPGGDSIILDKSAVDFTPPHIPDPKTKIPTEGDVKNDWSILKKTAEDYGLDISEVVSLEGKHGTYKYVQDILVDPSFLTKFILQFTPRSNWERTRQQADALVAADRAVEAKQLITQAIQDELVRELSKEKAAEMGIEQRKTPGSRFFSELGFSRDDMLKKLALSPLGPAKAIATPIPKVVRTGVAQWRAAVGAPKKLMEMYDKSTPEGKARIDAFFTVFNPTGEVKLGGAKETLEKIHDLFGPEWRSFAKWSKEKYPHLSDSTKAKLAELGINEDNIDAATKVVGPLNAASEGLYEMYVNNPDMAGRRYVTSERPYETETIKTPEGDVKVRTKRTAMRDKGRGPEYAIPAESPEAAMIYGAAGFLPSVVVTQLLNTVEMVDPLLLNPRARGLQWEYSKKNALNPKRTLEMAFEMNRQRKMATGETYRYAGRLVPKREETPPDDPMRMAVYTLLAVMAGQDEPGPIQQKLGSPTVYARAALLKLMALDGVDTEQTLAEQVKQAKTLPGRVDYRHYLATTFGALPGLFVDVYGWETVLMKGGRATVRGARAPLLAKEVSVGTVDEVDSMVALIRGNPLDLADLNRPEIHRAVEEGLHFDELPESIRPVVARIFDEMEPGVTWDEYVDVHRPRRGRGPKEEPEGPKDGPEGPKEEPELTDEEIREALRRAREAGEAEDAVKASGKLAGGGARATSDGMHRESDRILMEADDLLSKRAYVVRFVEEGKPNETYSTVSEALEALTKKPTHGDSIEEGTRGTIIEWSTSGHATSVNKAGQLDKPIRLVSHRFNGTRAEWQLIEALRTQDESLLHVKVVRHAATDTTEQALDLLAKKINPLTWVDEMAEKAYPWGRNPEDHLARLAEDGITFRKSNRGSIRGARRGGVSSQAVIDTGRLLANLFRATVRRPTAHNVTPLSDPVFQSMADAIVEAQRSYLRNLGYEKVVPLRGGVWVTLREAEVIREKNTTILKNWGLSLDNTTTATYTDEGVAILNLTDDQGKAWNKLVDEFSMSHLARQDGNVSVHDFQELRAAMNRKHAGISADARWHFMNAPLATDRMWRAIHKWVNESTASETERVGKEVTRKFLESFFDMDYRNMSTPMKELFDEMRVLLSKNASSLRDSWKAYLRGGGKEHGIRAIDQDVYGFLSEVLEGFTPHAHGELGVLDLLDGLTSLSKAGARSSEYAKEVFRIRDALGDSLKSTRPGRAALAEQEYGSLRKLLMDHNDVVTKRVQHHVYVLMRAYFPDEADLVTEEVMKASDYMIKGGYRRVYQEVFGGGMPVASGELAPSFPELSRAAKEMGFDMARSTARPPVLDPLVTTEQHHVPLIQFALRLRAEKYMRDMLPRLDAANALVRKSTGTTEPRSSRFYDVVHAILKGDDFVPKIDEVSGATIKHRLDTYEEYYDATMYIRAMGLQDAEFSSKQLKNFYTDRPELLLPKHVVDMLEQATDAGMVNASSLFRKSRTGRMATSLDAVSGLLQYVKLAVTSLAEPAFFVGQLFANLPLMYRHFGAKGSWDVFWAAFEHPQAVGRITVEMSPLAHRFKASSQEARILFDEQGTPHLIDDIVDALRRNGVDQTLASTEMARPFLNDLKGIGNQGLKERARSWLPFVGDKRSMVDTALGSPLMFLPPRVRKMVVQGALETVQGIDMLFRASAAVKAVHGGQTYESAARLAKEAFFDYNRLTDFERTVMRVPLMWYSFIGKDIRAHFAALVNHPSTVLQQMRLLRGQYGGVGNLTYDEVQSSDPRQGRLSVNVGLPVLDSTGKPDKRYKQMNLITTPFGDYDSAYTWLTIGTAGFVGGVNMLDGKLQWQYTDNPRAWWNNKQQFIRLLNEIEPVSRSAIMIPYGLDPGTGRSNTSAYARRVPSVMAEAPLLRHVYDALYDIEAIRMPENMNPNDADIIEGGVRKIYVANNAKMWALHHNMWDRSDNWLEAVYETTQTKPSMQEEFTRPLLKSFGINTRLYPTQSYRQALMRQELQRLTRRKTIEIKEKGEPE